MITLTNAAIQARLLALSSLIDGGSGTATLTIYAGTQPSVTGGTTAEPVLAIISLPRPCLESYTSRSLTLALPSVSYASGNGTATWARLTSGAGVILADMGAGGAGQDVVLSNPAVLSGGTVTVTSLIIRE